VLTTEQSVLRTLNRTAANWFKATPGPPMRLSMNPRRVTASVLLALGVTALAPAGLAFAKSSGSTAASIALAPSPSTGTVSPALGSSVWFTTAYSSTTKNPVIDSECYQNGTIVWSEVDTVSYAAQYGVLLGGDSSPWLQNGGSASCVSMLQSRTFKPSGEVVSTLAQTSFTAAAS
jgi:hypothetical protein